MLGVLYRDAGRFEEARQAYERALAIDSSAADAHRNLGILYDLYLQEPRKALVHYELYRRHGGEDSAVVERWLADIRQRLAEGGQAPGTGEEAGEETDRHGLGGPAGDDGRGSGLRADRTGFVRRGAA